MLLVNLGQFNQDNWELVNFPNFCRDVKNFCITFKKFHLKNIFKETCSWQYFVS